MQRTILLLPLLFARLTLSAVTQPAPPPPHLATEVMTALGIQDHHSNFLPTLDRCIASLKESPEHFETSLTPLVDALLQGPHPTDLLDQIYAAATITDRNSGLQEIKNWPHGSHSDRQNIANALWKQALATAPTHPARAQQLARAFILFEALNDFKTTWRGLGVVTEKSEDATRLLALPPDQFNALTRIITARMKESTVYQDESWAAFEAIDRLSQSPEKPLDPAELKNAMQHLDTAYRTGPRQSGYRWEIIRNTWQIQNLATARKDPAAAQSVRTQLQTWKRDATDPNVQHWLNEALTLPGPPPGKMIERIKITVHQDGSMERTPPAPQSK